MKKIDTAAQKPMDISPLVAGMAKKIKHENGLSDQTLAAFMVQANHLVDMLMQNGKSAEETWGNLEKLAHSMVKCKGTAYAPRVTHHTTATGQKITLMEPPCGSNICFFQTQAGLVCVDGGYTCYEAESLQVIQDCYPDFDARETHLLLTHADVDHIGLNQAFDHIYVSQACYENFQDEYQNRPNIRERNPLHSPHIRMTKMLAHYKPTPMPKLHSIGGRKPEDEALFVNIGTISFGDFHFEVFEGAGGHVPGEVVFVEQTQKLAFAGDLYVNRRDFTDEQFQFSKLAPYLMTSVDTNPTVATPLRKAVQSLLTPGTWLLIGGHGAVKKYDIPTPA